MEENRTTCIFGMHPVLEAVRSGKTIDKLMLKKGLDSLMLRELLEEAKRHEIPFQFVPVEKLDKVAKGGAHQGVVAYLSTIGYSDFEEAVDKACATTEA